MTKPEIIIKNINDTIRKKALRIDNINKEIEVLRHQRFKQELRIGKIEQRKQEKCKHDGEIYMWKNQRDDASFDYYVGCKKCKKWIGCKEFNGEVKLYK